ncbi:MAG: DUF3796 domain-containing protein [Firmicutes bacterium]|nr:DUF3796 domain-containing protein [Bacillota bacterium]
MMLQCRSRTGWFGFLGFLGSYSDEPQFVFFAFFGFFSFCLVRDLAREMPEEQVMERYQRADSTMLKFYQLLLAALFVLAVLNETIFRIQSVSMKIVEFVIAFLFAFSLILRSYLIYRRD